MKTSPFLRTAFGFLLMALVLGVPVPMHAGPGSSSIVISQVYGGGGNSGATWKNDFVELFNRSSVAVDITGWTVQYASSAGTSWQKSNNLSGIIQPGQYYLVQMAAGSGGTTALPTPDGTGSIAMSATAGKIALVNNATLLTGSCPTGLIDFVGFGGANCFEGSGPTAALSNTTAALRNSGGCTDTDDNAADFTVGVPNPRNSASPLNVCTGPTSPKVTGSSSPSLAYGGTSVLLTATVLPGGNPVSTGLAVTGDLSVFGGSNAQPLFDDGTNGDAVAGDNIFSFTITVPNDATSGNKTIPLTVADAQSRTGTGSATVFVAPPNVPIPQIQGTGESSPYAGQQVSTTGVVTGRKSNGFFIQDPTGDGDPATSATSDGIFVFTSSAPPAAAAAGNLVTVAGTVQEFKSSSDPNGISTTEIAGSPVVVVISTGNALPEPVVLTPADTPSGARNPLSRFAGMRVKVESLTVVGPTDGTLSEANATTVSDGVFYGVITGVPRPFREAGISFMETLPVGTPCCVPIFDENMERIRVDSDAIGGAKIDVASGALIANMVGPLDYGSRTYTILPDPSAPPTVSGNIQAVPVRLPNGTEFTVAAFNMERFYDTANDADTSDVVLTATAFANRLNKASLAIVNVLRVPDILAVEEMENLTTLQALADKVNTDAAAAGYSNPGYQPHLVSGNDIGGINVGFLVKSSRVSVVDVTQVGKDATYLDPTSGTQALLNDRPPLVLRAVVGTSPMSMPITVIVNHLRSLSDVENPTDGRVRAKRAAQAEFLANLIQSHQAADPLESIVSVGDYNAFEVNDGYADVMGTIRGQPAPVDQVVVASQDLVDPDLTDLVTTLPHDQQYSYSFGGNAQVLDHVLVNPPALASVTEFGYGRTDADFPEIYRNDPNRPERLSDHDPAIAYFSLIDKTAPSVSCGAADGQWHADDITIGCTARDGGSGLADSNDASFNLSTSVPDGSETADANTNSRSICDAQGNCASGGPVGGNRIDKKAPTLNAIATANGLPYASGTWTNQDITVRFQCQDLGAGVATSTPPVVLNTEGAGQSVSGSCTDNVGHSSGASFAGVNIDKTLPVVALNGIANGATYTLGAVPPVTCSTTDALSGVAAPAVAKVTGGTSNGVGTFTATCTGARDRAGNEAPPVVVNYTVAYNFLGLNLPPAPRGSYNAGAIIPVNWFLTNSKGRLITADSSFVDIFYAANTDCAGAPEGPQVDARSVGRLSEPVGILGFTFLWQTKGIAPGCYNIMVKLDDTTTHSVMVKLR